jgi:hypothetical protein
MNIWKSCDGLTAFNALDVKHSSFGGQKEKRFFAKTANVRHQL